MKVYLQETINKFWSRIDKTTSKKGCWEWTGGVDKRGYAKFYVETKTRIWIHRLSYEISYGEIPENLFVLHKCDNPKCVNPEHLYAGTQKQNIRDAVNRGRFARQRGEKNGFSKLKNLEVIEIRRLYNSKKYSQHQLARKFHISRATIQKIVTNVYWRHLL